ncbi:MAG: hypothetical protein IKD69_04020 [Solobacterium sp.]|nr:hypothetical protein [Solobacterium sp.]
MGTFAGYTGPAQIPFRARGEFADRMMKLLNYGGMMNLQTVSMYDGNLYLLDPLEMTSPGKITFDYNYFEDDWWETAGFDACNGVFWSNKIGGKEFYRVVIAAYTLVSLYDPEPGIVTDGNILRTEFHISWINHLLGTSYSCEKSIRLWDQAESYAFHNEAYEYDPFQYNDILSLIPWPHMYYAGGTDLADLLYITKGTETLTVETVKPGTYPADILECRNRLARYFQSRKSANDLEKIWKLVSMDRKGRQETDDPEMKEVAEMTLMLPARVIVYLSSEILGKNFWMIWHDLYDSVYHDEEMKEYASASLRRKRLQEFKRPIAPTGSSDFLYMDNWFTFYDTPKELMDKPKYIVSDDDRLYWWDGSDEVIISEEMDQWLHDLSERHGKLMEEDAADSSDTDSDASLKKFFALLGDIDSYYGRLYPFKTMFYEFIRNLDKKPYTAAVSLLHQLSEENREEGAAMRLEHFGWKVTSRKITFNPGRIRMKRFMSIMANRKLRQQYFGF